MRKVIFAIVAALLSALTLAAPAIAASQSGDVVVIRKVDTSNFPNVALTVLKPQAASDNAQIKISENGAPISDLTVKTISESGTPIGTAVVIDSSAAAGKSGVLDREKAAALQLVSSKGSNEQFAIISTGAAGRIVQTMTSDLPTLNQAINSIQAEGANVLWRAVKLGSEQLDSALYQPNLVVVSASTDSGSGEGDFTAANSAVRTAKAAAFTIGITQSGSVNEDNLKTLASNSGGRYYSTAQADATTKILAGIDQDLSNQAVVTYTSPSKKSALDISVQVGTGVANAHVSIGTVSEGASIATTVVDKAPSFFNSPLALITVAIISLACVALLFYGILEIVGNEKNQLSRALRPYSDEPEEQRDITKLADSEIIKKAVAATAKAAEDRGLLQVVQSKLEQADLPFRPAEALFINLIVAAIAGFLGAAFMGLPGLVIGIGLIGAVPYIMVGSMAKRRRRKFTKQLPDTLQLLAGSLRAGYSLVQGLDAVSKQCDAPMGPELVRAMAEARLGRPVEEALQEISDRMQSEDFEWAVMAIKIQREVGGNLAELLMTVSETMTARERLRREVKALTAEGRISAIVLAGLPPLIGIIISVINPGYMQPMLDNTLGVWALIGGGLMIAFGYWAMMKLIEVEA